MKTKNIGIWAIATLAASLFAVPAARSAKEKFSANLVGGMRCLRLIPSARERSACK